MRLRSMPRRRRIRIPRFTAVDRRYARPAPVACIKHPLSDQAQHRLTSANLYSLVETCKANGIGPCNHLIRLLQCLPLAQTVDGYTRLLPWNMRSNPHESTEA
ncbi:transposase domain-containing protein [Burkholderia cepacia]|uniref:transposase domain-containing protein n=1 Tax=Burkholderia cepacia TaxID=292 RepID=UPI003C7E8E48